MQNQFQVHVPQTQVSEPGKNVLYVSDLPQNITERDLVLFFDEYKEKILVVNILPPPDLMIILDLILQK